jgi:hypothetical protein
MAIVTRNLSFALLSIALGSSLIGCVMDTAAQDTTATDELLLSAACAAPAAGTGAVCDAGDGRLTYQVTLPSGQQYVEVFARQNGVQNLATAIQAGGVDHGDGTTTYALTRDGYAASDRVEYRFYSYLPGSPGVFTPGPVEARWYGGAVTTSVPVSQDAAVIYASLGTGPAANRNFGGQPSVDVGEYHLTSEGLFGYSLLGIPAGATVVRAEWVLPTVYAPGGPTVTLRLNRVVDAWSESAVTWNSKPAYGYLRDVQLTSGVVNRIDVTAEVAAALASRSLTLAVQPSTQPTIDNVFIEAREKGGSGPTSLSITWQ